MDPNENTAGGNFESGLAPAPGAQPGGFGAPQPNAFGQPAAAPGPGMAGMPLANDPAAGQPASTGGLPPLPAMPAPALQQPAQPATADTPAVADDSDLIEKEWVNKAKSIVEKTRHDPYQQSREISRLKADYLQKRYGKQVKLDE